MYRDQFGDFACGYWGLKGERRSREITLAENEMPGVLEMRKRYGPTKPLTGAKIFISCYSATLTLDIRSPSSK